MLGGQTVINKKETQVKARGTLIDDLGSRYYTISEAGHGGCDGSCMILTSHASRRPSYDHRAVYRLPAWTRG